MLELIFQGFMEWAYGLVLECWEYFSSALLDIMSLDFAYLESHVPILNDLMQVLLAAGWALLIGNLVFQAAKSMLSGLGFEGEDPKLLFIRTFIFAFLLLASPQICKIGLDITSKIMDALEIPDAINVTLVDDSIFGNLTASWLLVIICGLIIMFKVFRLILEIAERYVILAILTFTAPLAFAMGGSRNTSEIFAGWCRMFGSMCVLMVLNVVFFKMLLSILSTVPSGLDVLPWMILIMTVVKVARKADAIVTRIGLNPAITGDTLGVQLPGALTYMVIRGLTSQVTKTVGKSAGGNGKGASPNTPPGGNGGGPRSGGPSGGRNGPTGSAASYAYQSSQQVTSQENSHQQGTSQQNTTQHGGVAQVTAQPASAREQNAGTSSTSSQIHQDGAAAQPSRKSLVPPGVRRSPSYIKAGPSPTIGLQVPGRPDGDLAQTMAWQEYCPNMQSASGKPAGCQLSTAGTRTGSTVRFTHTTAQTIYGGDASGGAPAAEQSTIPTAHRERSAASHSGPPPSAPAVPPGRTVGGSVQQYGQPPMGATRFTHRESVQENSSQTPAASIQPQTPPPPAPGQPGPAGIAGSSRVSERPAEQPRPGRNGFPGAPPPAKPQASGPARQELRAASAPTAPPLSGGASRPHPGPTGTSAAGRQMGQTSGTQFRQTAVAPAAEAPPGSKRPTPSPATLRGGAGGTWNGAARSSKQRRGPKHGK